MAKPSLTSAEVVSLQADFEDATPQAILKWAASTCTNLVVVTSFQPTGIVTLHMLQAINPQLPVITLDTGFLFPQTEAVIAEMTTRFDLNLIRVKPELSVDEQAKRYGDKLWESNPDLCCQLRKIEPLQKALAPYSAWITGLRRDQSPTRQQIPIIGWDTRHQMMKFCPFANWTEEMIWAYINAYKLPYNTLHDLNYPSIGCTHCTHAAQLGDDLRAGRWVNFGKTECGIHVPLLRDQPRDNDKN